jgi:hypothetical protein
MPKLLRESKAIVVCELHPYAWAEMGVTIKDLEEILIKSDRKMKWLDGGIVDSSSICYGTVLIERK